VHLDYATLTLSRPPVGGLLPDAAALSRTLSAIGLTPERHVVAYDDEGGGKASRLLWTLDLLGHERFSLLDGGYRAWTDAGLPLDTEPVIASGSKFEAVVGETARAGRDYILGRLGAPDRDTTAAPNAVAIYLAQSISTGSTPWIAHVRYA
jgi:thiosulfate/3-mercaptopyruvate sulfurtransferase